MDNQEASFAKKRKIVFIEKKFQRDFIIKFCALAIAGGIVTTSILYFLTTQSSTVSFINSRATVQTTADFLLPLLVQTVLMVTIIMGIAVIVVTLFVSHKIAGPLYRIKKVMKDLEEGDFSGEFRLRHRDQLQDLARSFNDMITRNRERFKALEERIENIKNRVDYISDLDISEKKRSDLQELKKICAELNRIIHGIKF